MCYRILLICLMTVTAAVYTNSAAQAAVSEMDNRVIKLPPPSRKGEVSVEQTIQERRSIRDFSDIPLTLKEISQILWAAGGATVDGITGPTRAYPSAGAVYPLEVYLVAGNITALAPGIYHYDWKGHTLSLIKMGDFRSALMKAALNQRMIKEAPATIIVTALYSKITQRYGRRGAERYVSMDAGHLGQNVHLIAQGMGLGTVMVGAFSDQEVSEIMEVNEREMPIYIMPVGRPQKK